ncbi:hypothetical protein ABT263_28040 [Kitasatospora sp. NPDC001603]|uniref:hypothetical protein n=1 Tax=Kitasatospora sp. NPDC001603 TaxID=3154388 RepID=UPI00331F2F7C
MDNAPRCEPPRVLLQDEVLREFLTAAVEKYQFITSRSPLPCFALLLGSAHGNTFAVERIAFARNARTEDPAARVEFTASIIPRFGTAYENEARGWWVNSSDLLSISREAEADGLDLLGSIHLHPDWHRIGPPSERHLVLSDHPTPMDQHTFGRTSWPVNLICYLERRGSAMYHSLAAWSPPSEPDDQCHRIPLLVTADVTMER